MTNFFSKLPTAIRPAGLLVVLAAGLASGCSTNPVSGEQDFVLMSESREIELGRESHPQIIEKYRKYEDPGLQAYVQRIGQDLASNSHRPGLAYHFTVLDSTDINAFALPGGYIYITRGLLAYLNSEAELAAVLGHELGHVTARHGVRQQSTATATGLLGTIVAAASGIQGSQKLADLASTAITRGYGREHELEADRLGAQYLARSNYDPQAMIEVIGVLKNQELFSQKVAREEGREPNTYHGLFASHPDNDTRLQQVVGEARNLRASTAQPRIGRDEFLQHLDGLTFGASEHEGILRDGKFYHPELGFALQFPANWRVRNSPDQLQAQPQQADAALLVQVEPVKRGITSQQFIDNQLKVELQGGKPLTLSGLQGYTGQAWIGQGGAAKPGRISVITMDEHAFIIAGITDDVKLLRRYDKDFLQTARSLHRLTGEERELAHALHIRIVTARQGDTFATLAGRSKIPRHAETQLRLLNDHYPDGKLTVGEDIKIIE